MSDRPNILLIQSDQHSGQMMGCAEDDIVRTPNLDGLAENGVIFDNCQCGCPQCVASRMSMLTGRHCSDIDVWSNQCRLETDVPTFVHALGAGGYETVLCGRMHFNGPDQRHGYHKRIFGELSDHRYWGAPRADIGHIPLRTAGQCRESVETAGPGRTSYQAYDEEVVQRAGEFLDERNDERPLFLTAGFVLPHCPFIAEKERFEYYHERVGVPEVPEGYFQNMPEPMQKWRETRNITDLTDEEIRTARAGYYGLVEHFDSVIGRLLEALEQSSIADNTIVIYISDHGDAAGNNGLWWKSQFYDHAVGVPMIFSGPGIPSGERVEQVVSLLDLGPTLTEMADAPPMRDISGQSMVSLMNGEDPTWRNEAFSEMINLGPTYPYPGRMIRKGPWKLIHYDGADPILFNLDEDPNEFVNRADDPECKGIRDYLHDRARHGWDPDRALQILRQRARDRQLRVDWYNEWPNPPGPGDNRDYWPAPEGSTDFPMD